MPFIARIALILFVITECGGCATAITQTERELARSPDQEIDSDGALLHARYLGDSKTDGFDVARIIVTESRKECSDRPPVEMLLPLTIRQSARPRLIEAGSLGPLEGSPVRIVIDRGGNSNAAENDQPRWEGYPSVIRLRHRWDAAPEISYRFGPKEIDLRHDDMEVELDWVCRSRVMYAGFTALLPVAVALDIATFPVQLILVILGGH